MLTVQRAALISLSGFVLIVGCGRRNPVEEVSLAESGVILSESFGAQVGDGDWNGWRGPANNGIAPPQELPIQWDEQANIRWRTELPGRGHGSPVVVGNSVFVATARLDKQQQLVICLNRDDGIVQWMTAIHEGGFPSSRKVHKKGTNANGTIACDGEHLFIGMFNSDAIIATALDLDGEIVWQREVGKFVSKFGYGPSPILYKSLVVFAADNGGGGYLAALDSSTGEIAWRVARGAADSYSSPVVATVGGRDQLLISGCDAVTSYDPASGEQLWRTPCIAEGTCGTVVASSDRIFASGGHPEKETVCLSATGERIWSNDTKLYEPSMLVVGERLVAVTDGGIAMCWSAESGETLWKKRLGGNFSASPVLCGEHVYVSNLKGDTFVFRAGERFETVARNRLGDDCYASPAIASGDIFLRIGVGTGSDRTEQIVCISASSVSPSD